MMLNDKYQFLKRVIVSFLLVFNHIYLFASNKDSLQLRLNNLSEVLKVKNDSISLNELSLFAIKLYDDGEHDLSINAHQTLLNFYLKNQLFFKAAKTCNSIGNSYLFVDKLEKSIEYYFDGLRYFKKENDKGITNFQILEADLNSNIGLIHSNIGNYSYSLTYLKKANTIYEENNVSDASKLAVLYNMFGHTFSKLEQFEKSLSYFKKSEKILESSNNKYLKTVIFNNLAFNYFQLDSLESSKYYYKLALHNYAANNVGIQNESIYSGLAQVYLKQELLDSAKICLDSSLSYRNSNNLSISTYKSAIQYYNQVGDSIKSIPFLYEANKLIENYNNPKLIHDVHEIHYKYELEQIKEKEALQIQNEELKQVRLYLIILIILIFSIIASVWFVKRIKKIRAEKGQITDELDYKKGQLSSYAFHIVKESEFLEKVNKEIQMLKNESEDPKKFNSLLATIGAHSSTLKEKQEFELMVEDEYSSFFYNLETKHSNLTDYEKKLCSLLVIGLSSKEITTFLNIEDSSVRTSRSRLRKKLGLVTGDSLVDYLKSFR